MVDNAKHVILKLDLEIQIDIKNYELYLEKAQQQIILAYEKLGENSFLQELQNVFQTFETATLINSNCHELVFSKKRKFCEQIIQDLDQNSIEYFEILLQTMKIYDYQITITPQDSEFILKQKIMYIEKHFGGYCGNLTAQKIEYLKEICQNCIVSMEKQNQTSIQAEIQNLLQQAKIYIMFAKILEENNNNLPIENNMEFQSAQKKFKRIIGVLDESEKEFPNQLDHLEFQQKTLVEIKFSLTRDSDKIEFQELICSGLEKICQINPYFHNFSNLIYEFQQLLVFQNKEDIKILNKMSKALDQIIELSKKDQEFFQLDEENNSYFYQDCFTQKAQIYERIAKQENFLDEKEKYFCMAVKYYQRAYMQDQNFSYLINQKIKALTEIPVHLGIQHKQNKYYDQILQTLEECQDLTLFDDFINDEFETIVNRLIEKDQQVFVKKLFQLLNFIFFVASDKSQHSFVEFGCILERMGDKVKNVDNQYLYDKSLSSFDKAINTLEPYPTAINNKLSLLLKLNQNLKALGITKSLIKLKNTDLPQEKCFSLLVNISNFREALLVGRLPSNIRSFSNIQYIQKNV